MAAATKTARAVTNRLFQTAVECGKRVRTETGLSSRPASVPGIALSLAGRIFESLSGKKVLVLGAGEVAELTARLLVDEGVTSIVFCNRSPEKAAALADASGGATEPWDRRHEAFSAADIVVSATGSPDPIVDAERLRPLLSKRARRGPLLVLDLAVPRDVDPRVDDIPDLYRYDVDSLGALSKRNALERQAEVPHAEAIVDEMVSRFSDWYGSLLHVDVVRKLREAMEKTRREELQRFAGKISELDPEGRALVERITESLLNKVLHGPTVGLKKGDPSERLQRAEVVKALFHLEDE